MQEQRLRIVQYWYTASEAQEGWFGIVNAQPLPSNLQAGQMRVCWKDLDVLMSGS